MRVWSTDESGRICLDGNPYWWVQRPDRDEQILRQFIVDALNEKEQREEIQQAFTVRLAVAADQTGLGGRDIRS